jgi:HK97 family phage major capsid protein
MSALLSKLIEQRTALQTEMDGLVEAPMAETRSAETANRFTPEEEARFGEIRTELDVLDPRITDLRDMEARKAAAAKDLDDLGLGNASVTVLHNERTYRRGGEARYYQDLCSAAISPMGEAAYRLARHGKEMEIEARDKPRSAVAATLRSIQARLGIEERTGLTTSVGSGGTFLPPDYLLDEYIALPRPERVLMDVVRQQNLPKGPMTIEIPKITAGTAVTSQGTQNTAVTETDLTDAYVAASVNTIAGQQTVSLQAIEQSSVPFDEIVFADLLRALDAQLEYQGWQGSGSSGQLQGVLGVSGITTVTYTDGSPTAVKAYPFLGAAKSAVFKSIFRAADAIFMTPDRWAWFETGADANGRPLVTPSDNGPWNTIGTVDGQMRNGPTPAGKLFGLPVFIAAQLPTNLGSGTNQDDIAVISTKDLILWESAPVSRALPQTLGNQLSVLLQTYEYAAFMPNRLPGAIAIEAGTGLVTPVF